MTVGSFRLYHWLKVCISFTITKKLRTDKKISLIKIAISSPKTGSQFIVKFSVAALRTVLFLTTEWSYILIFVLNAFISYTAVVFNKIHVMRQTLSLLAPFKILLLSPKVSDTIADLLTQPWYIMLLVIWSKKNIANDALQCHPFFYWSSYLL